MYPEQMVAPMRAEMTSVGFTELKSADEVNNTIPKADGTVLCFINSVCGCSAGTARPGVKLSLQSEKRPDKLVTVFAGNDPEAVAQVRQFLLPYPPSSPAIALFKDGKLVHMIERHHIEGRTADMIAENLAGAYEQYC
jgi:putative YphP/YqiW family bacilliredoxin